jgi:hypothetical protein
VKWRVSTEVSLSDYRIIKFRMSADPKLAHEYRNPLFTDWECYKTELVSGFGDWGGDILTEDDIENSVNVLQSKIIAAYEKTCPLKTARLNQSTPYSGSDLARLGGHGTTVIQILRLVCMIGLSDENSVLRG